MDKVRIETSPPTRPPIMNILIVGTGALASLFAARLTRAGHTITMLGTWREGLDSLNQDGVRLVDADGNESQYPVRATSDPRECAGAKNAIVLVKAWQTERVATQLRDCLADDGLALTLQNGLGNRETLIQSLGSNRAALGSTTTGATLLGPGQVKAGGEGVISLEQNQALGPLEAALKAAGFNVQSVEDAGALIWGKLVVNAAINPLTALLRVKNGELLKRPSARELMKALALETAEVAQAEGIQLSFDDPLKIAEDVAHKTAENTSSMLQDVLRGAPTEIDAICGAVVRVGEIHGIETPVNRVCWQLVKALLRGHSARG
ncbi:MAG: 2-dehydropantoate 2-reductase [Anaerolineales bacterium]|nr:2-dehydropantoate 2-reductase [Anaerolineales bacterium]